VTIDVQTGGQSANHPPSGADKSVSLFRGVTTYVFTAADFGFSDPSDSPANSMLGVVVVTLPLSSASANSGALLLNGASVQTGELISAANLLAGQLTYAVQGTISGPAGSFTFQVKDDGGTANGGSDLDPTPDAVAFNVVNPWHNSQNSMDVN